MLASVATFAALIFFASVNSAQLPDRFSLKLDRRGNPELVASRHLYRGRILLSSFILDADSVFEGEIALSAEQTAAVKENYEDFYSTVRGDLQKLRPEEIEFPAFAKIYESKIVAANRLLQKELNKEQLAILHAAVLRSRIYRFGLVYEISKGSLSKKGLNSPDIMKRIRSKSQSIESKFLKKLRETHDEQLHEFLQLTDSGKKFEQLFGKWPKKSIPILTLIKKFDGVELEPTRDFVRPKFHPALNSMYPVTHRRYRSLPRGLSVVRDISVQRDDSLIHCYLRYLMSDEVLLRELDLTDEQDDKIHAFLLNAEKKIKAGVAPNRAAEDFGGGGFGKPKNMFAALEASLVKEMQKHVGFKRARKVEHLTNRFYFQLLGYQGFVKSQEMQSRFGASRQSTIDSLKTFRGQDSSNKRRKELRKIENWYFQEMLGDSKAAELQKLLGSYDGKMVHHVDILYLHHKRFTEDLARAKKSK